VCDICVEDNEKLMVNDGNRTFVSILFFGDELKQAVVVLFDFEILQLIFSLGGTEQQNRVLNVWVRVRKYVVCAIMHVDIR
jgi:hypothetical protein